VDDGSTDGTSALARRYPVRVIEQPRHGPAAARNAGARRACGDVVVFTDSDCVPEPAWLARLLTGFRDADTVGVGGSYGMGDDASLLARLIHEEIVARHGRFGDEVDFLGSFNVAYRRDAFHDVGGFDETFLRASGEDNDLAYRLQDAGGILRFVPDARVAHYHPTRLWPYLRTQARHGYWRMKLYRKHPRRSRGDHYAGPGDLAGPPVALVLAGGLIAAPVAPHAAYWPALGGLAFVYLVVTSGRAADVARTLGIGPGVAYRGMTVLRDVARGLGLIGGVWSFMVIRRGTA